LISAAFAMDTGYDCTWQTPKTLAAAASDEILFLTVFPPF
jgi:hypothetical protein